MSLSFNLFLEREFDDYGTRTLLQCYSGFQSSVLHRVYDMIVKLVRRGQLIKARRSKYL